MLKPEDTLVVIVDFQEKLINATKAQNELEVATKAVTAAKILDIPVLVSEQYPKGLGSTDNKIVENLPENSKILEKTSFSLLKTDSIAEAVKSFGKKQILLCGIETHICVLQTAIDMINNGHEVYLLKNACKSRQESECQAGTDAMRDEGAKIVTLEIALFEFLQSSKNPHFKEVQALIK